MSTTYTREWIREYDTTLWRATRYEVVEKPRRQAPPTLRQMRTKAKRRKHK